jgi:hypothetical protein
MKRHVPGLVAVEGREFLYIEALRGENVSKILDDMLRSSPNVPLPRAGGVIEEKAHISLGGDTSLIAISYKGDLPGWKKKIVAYCAEKGRKWGTPSNGKLALSDGREIDFSQAVLESDGPR